MASRTDDLHDHYDTVVIGGGQAGLAAGYHLRHSGLRFAILDAGQRVGDAWRARWDSLRLFTPARFSALPGLPVPGPPDAFPSKDQVADYLQAYADHFDLPVVPCHRVTGLDRDGERFRLTVNGRIIHSDHVIVATGATPRRPAFAGDLAAGVAQLHASDYRRPDQVPPGPVLVVGAGNSGAEIALDLALEPAGARTVRLAGRDTGRIPLITGRWYWWLVHRRLNVDTRLGRAFARVKDRGTPLARIRPPDLARAGVRRTPPVTGVRDGMPLLADGATAEVAAVVWCTGYRLDYSFIHLPDVVDEAGRPRHHRGVAEHAPGLYFVGLPFQYTLTSALIGGVGRDAGYVTRHLAGRPAVAGAARPTA